MLTMSHHYIAKLQDKRDFKTNRYAFKKNPEKNFPKESFMLRKLVFE